MTNIIKKALQVMVVVGSLTLPAAAAFAAYDNSLGVVASCTAADRGITTFSCSSFPTQWITGTAPNLSCYSGATVPTCGANQQFNCNSGSCVCNAGFTNCGSGCVATPFPTNNCSPGQTYNACTGCAGPSYVTLQTGTPTRQGASATNATISVHGDLDLAGGTQGDVYLSSGKMLRVDGAGATSLNIGNISSPGNFTLSAIGDLWIDDLDATGKGIQLEAADRPIITRGWDTFSTGTYAGVGRWGLFMEPNVLSLGVPNMAGKSFKLRAFNADSSGIDRFAVDMSNGNTTVTGNLSVAGSASITGGMTVGGTTTLNNVNITGTINSANGFTLPAGAGAGKVLTSDAAGVASWQSPAASGLGGTGTVNALPKFTAASTLGNSLVSESGTTVTVAGSLAVTGGLSLPTATAVGLGNVANALNFDSNTLVVDALNNRVGINTAAPIMPLAVQSDTGANTVADAAIFFNRVGVAGANGQGTRIYINAQQGTSRGTYIEGVITTSSSNGHDMVFGTSAASSVPTERMRITSSGNLLVGADTDVISTFGRTDVGCSAYSDYACISHVDQDATGTYALLQYNDGRTFLNSAPSQPLYLRIGNADRLVVSPSGNLVDVRGMTNASEGIALGGKLGISGGYSGDTWLRLNQDSDFTSGVYTPANLRVDGSVYIGSSQYLRRYNSSWLETNSSLWMRGTSAQVDQGLDARASTAAAAITATSNSSGSWAAAIVGNSYTTANSYGQDGSMWIGGGLDVAKGMSSTTGHFSNWIQADGGIWSANGQYNSTNGSLQLHRSSTSNDTSYEWVGFYSGSTRQGIMIWDGDWNDCSSNVSFCIKAEQSNDLTLKAGSGRVVIAGSQLYVDRISAPNNNSVNVHGAQVGLFILPASSGGSTGWGVGVRSASSGTPVVMFNDQLSVFAPVWGGSYVNKSSLRYKHDPAELSDALGTLDKIRGVEFTWNDDAPDEKRGQRDVGVIAEEVAKAYPWAVSFDEEGNADGVVYSKLIPLLIEAVKEQQTQIDSLESRLEALEAKLK